MANRANVTTSVLTSTLDNYRPTLTDAIYKGIPTIRLLNSKGRVKRLKGGDAITAQILYAQNSTVKALGSTTATIDVTPQEESRNLVYPWTLYAGAVSIPKMDLRNNKDSDAKIFDLLESKTKNIKLTFQSVLNQALYASSAAATSLVSIPDMVAATGTVGGVAYSVGTYWQSTVTTSGSFASQGVSDMRTNFLTVSQGNDTPHVGLCDKTTYGWYENSQLTIQRYVDTRNFDAGAEALAFKNAAIVPDADCTSATLYFINLDYVELDVHEDAEFAFSPAIEPNNQDVETYKVIWQGNFTTDNRRMHGKLTTLSA